MRLLQVVSLKTPTPAAGFFFWAAPAIACSAGDAEAITEKILRIVTAVILLRLYILASV
jgi:hypothetical protein